MNQFRNAHIKPREKEEGPEAQQVQQVLQKPAAPEPAKQDNPGSVKHSFIHLRAVFREAVYFGRHADIALARDEASRFLPWIIALMVYLAALVLAGSFTLNHTITVGHSARTQSFSVHLPHVTDKEHDTSDKALALVKAVEGVEDASIVSNRQIQDMVEPWFGKGDVLANLPLPVVIEAKLKDGATIDYAILQGKLQNISPGATIDDHKKWLEQFSAFIKVMQFTLICIAMLIIFTTASIVIFACKTSLKIHRGTVNLLHRLGAFDSYIATQFQNYAGLLTLKGSFIGSGFASFTLLLLHFMAHHIESPLFPAFSFSLSHWLILFFLPVIMSVLALVVVRFSVLESLRRMP